MNDGVENKATDLKLYSVRSLWFIYPPISFRERNAKYLTLSLRTRIVNGISFLQFHIVALDADLLVF